jgi:hypothetical protein
MEAPVINHDGPIIIEETPAQKQDEFLKKLLEMTRESSSKEIPSITNMCGVLVG